MTEKDDDATPRAESLFREQADSYARYRPTYPGELYDYLVAEATPCRLALDCATGNGQAAVDLADRADYVVATDVSEEQLQRAQFHPDVGYRCAPAEATGLSEDAVDLVTIAAGLHWFDFDAFYDHLREIVRDGGVVAAWSYRTFEIDDAVDAVLERLRDDVLVSYWHPRVEYNWEAYETIPFPFDELDAPSFEAQMEWTLEQLLGFASTWSAVQHHVEQEGEDPLQRIRGELEAAWGDPETTRTVTIPLHMRAGVVGASL